MPRLPRFVLPGHPQHVIQRGNNRGIIFRRQADWRFFLEKLEQGAEKHNVDIHAYVLMTNHVHLLLTPHRENGIGALMQYLGRYYVQYFNRQYKRTGTLWEGRYKATLIDAETYMMACYRYIEMNPVRAAMVDDPGRYPWSSYHANALGRTDSLVTPHALYSRLGQNSAMRQQAYRELFTTPVPEQTLHAIRETTNKAWLLGNDAFREAIAKRLNRRTDPQSRGGDRRSESYRSQQP